VSLNNPLEPVAALHDAGGMVVFPMSPPTEDDMGIVFAGFPDAMAGVGDGQSGPFVVVECLPAETGTVVAGG